MRSVVHGTLGLSAMLAVLAGTPASAEDQGGASFQVRAVVPMACWVSTTSGAAADSVAGEAVEACNAGGGYRVTARHRPLNGGESAALVYDGAAVSLQRSGVTALFSSQGPGLRRVAYRLDGEALTSPLSFSVTIEPRA